jgi:hypothetical protein
MACSGERSDRKCFGFLPRLWYKEHKGKEKSTGPHPLQNGHLDSKLQVEVRSETKLLFVESEDALFRERTMGE